MFCSSSLTEHFASPASNPPPQNVPPLTLGLVLLQMDVQVTLARVVPYIELRQALSCWAPQLQFWNKPTNKITHTSTTRWYKFPLLLPDTTSTPPPLLLLHSSHHSGRWCWLFIHNNSWKSPHFSNPRQVLMLTHMTGRQPSFTQGQLTPFFRLY